jgi:DUF4097 and DUF4098 domain-containing protein YvlB
MVLSLAAAAVLLGPSGAGAGTPIDETVPARADAEVTIENLSGSVSVVAGDGSDVHIGGTLSKDASRLAVETDDEEINIEVMYPKHVENIEDTDLEVRVPRGVAVRVETVSATVTIDGVEGEVDVETVSGSIGVTTAASRDGVRLESVSGSIRVRGNIQDVRAESVSGKIEIAETRGEVEASTTSGSLEISGGEFTVVECASVSGEIHFAGDPTAGAEFDFENLSGSITLDLPANLDAEVRVETFSGDIESDFEGGRTRSRSWDRDDDEPSALDAVYGSGSASFYISTFSGPVRIKKR